MEQSRSVNENTDVFLAGYLKILFEFLLSYAKIIPTLVNVSECNQADRLFLRYVIKTINQNVIDSS